MEEYLNHIILLTVLPPFLFKAMESHILRNSKKFNQELLFLLMLLFVIIPSHLSFIPFALALQMRNPHIIPVYDQVYLLL